MRSRSSNFILTPLFTFLGTLLISSPALAHKVNIYAYAEGKRVHVRAYTQSAPVKNAQIFVFAPDSAKVLETKIDEKGECVFDALFRADLRIEVNAGEGHTSNYILKADELPADLPTYEEWKQMPQKKTSDIPPVSQPAPQAPDSISISAKEIEQIVESVVERKIAPIRKMLLEQQEASEKASFDRVIAGLGIIFGVAGVMMYLRSLKRKGGGAHNA
jgi:nickel transport protein